MSVNALLRDEVVKHSVYLERYTKRELQDVLDILRKANDDVIAKIAATENPLNATRLENLLSEVRRIYAGATNEMKNRFNVEGPKLANVELNFSESLFGSLPIDVSFALITPEQVWVAAQKLPTSGGYLWDELFDAFDKGTSQRIITAIRQGFIEGESIGNIVKRLRGTKARNYKDGIMEASRRGAESLARTLINHLSTTAAMESYKNNDKLLNGVAWTATLDSATCVVCGELDGEVWEVNEPHPIPPKHLSCRCSIVPVLKDWRGLGFKASELSAADKAVLDGKPPGTITYNQWLKRQSAGVQDDILGVTRGKMFRKGTPLDSFVDHGKLLTLEELGAKK